MSHTYIADCSDSRKEGDTLIIIVNSDGTLSVDPETLQKLLANQHHNSPISLVRLDAKHDGNVDGESACEDDDDPDSRVNLTVEGYYPPTPAPSSPTPPPTPVPETNITADGNGSDVLADSITEILQPEDVEKLETALQSEHAKEILGDVVLDMLQKNGEDTGLTEDTVMSQQGSVVLDHCYASLTGPTAQPPAPPPPVSTVVVPTLPTRGTARGRGMKSGRGRGLVQTKLTLGTGATMVPVVEQLVMPGTPVTVASSQVPLRSPVITTAVRNQATVALQRVDLQQVLSTNVVPCKVMLNKVPMQPKPVLVAPLPTGAGEIPVVKSSENEIVVPKKKGVGRGRGVSSRGRGIASTRGRGQGRGRGVPKLSEEEEAKNKQLAEEMAATVRALTLAEAEQFAHIESMDQSSDADRVIPLGNKAPAKKPVKFYRRVVESGPKTIRVLKPEKHPQKLKVQKKSVVTETPSHEEKTLPEQKKEEKVIVVSMEPQITPAVVSAVVMSQSHSHPSVTPATPIHTPTHATPATTPGHRKNYPKRENRKPPAHLAEAFGPALFSTPDIIRRVSTDKPATPTTPATVATSTPLPPAAPVEPATSADDVSPPSKLADELGLTDADPVVEQDSLLDTLSSQVSKQEDQLLAEALLLDDLAALPSDDILQDEVRTPPTPPPPPPSQPETVVQPSMPSTTKKQVQKNKNLSQTSLSAFFPKVNQTKDEAKNETVVESTSITPQVPTAGVRKLPPIELPATRGATKRANLQKDQAQDTPKKQDIMKKVTSSSEKRKSTDSKKSTESRKSSGRSLGEDSEDMLVSDEGSDDEGSYNSEDDPNRLWCICKRPHNNRFMICCDICEDWFHGKCVGITKAMGEQMEEQEIEWMCPNCKKKKKQEEAAAKKQTEGKGTTLISPKKSVNPVTVESEPEISPAVKEKKTESSKVIVQHQKLVVIGHDASKPSNPGKGTEIRITKVPSRKSVDESMKVDSPKTPVLEHLPVNAQSIGEPANGSGTECIVCKKEAMAGGVYCSDECIAKHSSDSLSVIDKSAVVVFERKTGRMYGGPNGPTPSTLTSWLMAHPSYEVMRPITSPTAKYYNQLKPAAHRPPQALLKQTVLQTKPQGIQLIAALPQPPPVEGPLKKNLTKVEPVEGPLKKNVTKVEPTPPAPKPKQQLHLSKGQQQITSLLKLQQPKQEVAETKSLPNVKNVVLTPATLSNKKPLKELKKVIQQQQQQQPVAKKPPPAPVKRVVKEEAKPEQKKEEGRSKENEEQNVRASVKKTLQEVLTARLQEADDLRLSEDQIKKITTQIEEELYGVFKETNAKYKAKYRSLMFNIKDKNNLSLFRRIADKSLSPVQLVRLTPEELASQELAQWREREARHQLEMIKKTELDLMQQAKTVVMKTHKGEQVVENEDGLGGKALETSVEIEPVINVSAQLTPTTEVPTSKLKEDITKVKEDKNSKKEKREDKHKEHRHIHKSTHHKDHDRGRSRHRTRHRSGSDRRSRSKSKSQLENKPRSRSGSSDEPVKIKEKVEILEEKRGRSKSRAPERSMDRPEERDRSKSKPPSDRGRSKSRPRERSKSTPRERSKSRPRERSKSRPRERSKSRPRERSKSRPRERSKSRPRERSKSRPRERSKSRLRERSKSRARERSKSRPRERSKSRPRERSKSRPRERSKSRPRERSKSRPRERSKSRERSRSKIRPTDTKSHARSRSKSTPRETHINQPHRISLDFDEIKHGHLEESMTESLSLEKVHENIELPLIQPAIFDAEIKEIIHDVVIEEEIGPTGDEELSDREPSSTVNISTPPFNVFEEEPLKPPVWRGTLLMPDVAKFSTSIQEVSGICGDLEYDLPETINCVGRISPETAWDYIAKMKKSGTKQILVVRFSADNEEDKMSYLSFYSYLSSRNRLGVVGNNSKMIKDFYILPLPSHSPVPQVLLPLDGPGFEDYRPHLLLGIIVRTRRKRLLADRELPFVPKVAKKSERSYTPPLPDEGSHTPTQTHQHPATESFTPPHSPKPPRIIKLKPKTSRAPGSPTGSEDFVLEDGDTPYTPEDEEDDADAPYSPGEGADNEVAPVASPGCSAELQRKVDELNRMINDIEERKQKIDSMSTIVGMSPPQEIMVGTQEEEEEEEIEEAYSPSGSITPPATDTSYLDKTSSKISLPSDLQEIIASIKKKPDEPKSMDLKSDPIVQAYRTSDEQYSPEYEKVENEPVVEEKVATPNSEESHSTQGSIKSASISVKVNRDPRQRPAQLALNQLSDEEIMKKASEMGFMNPENPEPIPDKFKSRSATDPSGMGAEVDYEPFTADEDRSKLQHGLHPPMPMYVNQSYPSSHTSFSHDFPPPPRPPSHLPLNYAPSQFQNPHMYPVPPPPPPPPLPPSHIPFTNPQPPPPQPMYPPPPSQPAPLPPPPPPPSESPDLMLAKKKFSKKSKKKSRDPRSGRKEKKEKRKYSESPPPKDYDYDDSKFDKVRERDRYSKKRDKRETWRTYDKPSLPEKRRDSWEYDASPPTLPLSPVMAGPPPHPFGMPSSTRGGVMRGRFQRGMRGGFRRGGFDRPMRGFHRGGFHQRGGHHPGGGPMPGPSRNFQPKNIQNEFEEDIRRFEEQRLKQKNLERRRWRNESPPSSRKRRKDGDSD